MKKTLRFSACLLLISSFAFSQSDKAWKRANEQEIKTFKNEKGREFPQSAKYYNLDVSSLRQTLFSAAKVASESNVIISIPNVNGEMEQYKVWENSNFAPELQAQFPDIRAYSGVGIKDKTASISISVSPNGIQTMVLRADKKSEFIEPYSADGTKYALFNSEGRQFGETPFVCSTQDDHELENRLQRLGVNSTFSNNQSFKTLRLALSCTSEYTAYHGNTVAGALAGMNATMSRVNGVYAIDLAVKLEIIANNNLIIYTNAATDPYSDAGDPGANNGAGDGLGASGAWNAELQNNLTATLGNAAYDIGHLFGASGGGGNAGCIGCVCGNGKGSGFTSPYNNIPAGDLFDIDYVAHEMGHQLGANHTFSHSTEINGVNVEPGGGSTIMAYAGITNYNVQANSDDYFAYRSILQIQTNLATKTCPVSVPMSNTPPTINAGADYTIPKSTPFKLVGTGSDAQTNSALTYTWEQNDPANASVIAANSVASPTKTVGPNFRSLPPTSVPERYMPALSTVLSNNLSTTYESVSSVARTLNFTLTGRDHGTTGGQTSTDAMVVTVNAAVGPFDVTSQSTPNVSWTQGTTETITWAVNNTTTLAGSTNVDILLSTDGGLTYPITLKSNTPNDGSEAITVPNVAAPYCRVMVKPTGNIYYDINSYPFAIGYIVTTTTVCNTYTATPNATIVGTNPPGYIGYSLNVPDNVVISDINLSVNISHARINDLYIGLVKPGSSSVDRVVYQQGCSTIIPANTPIITTFDDSGVALACGGIGGGNTYKPLNSLDFFNGINSAGNWRLAVADVTVANSGTLNSFALNICSSTTTVVLSNEDFSLTNFSIYPNPNNGNFTVQFDSKSSNEIKIGVHDLRGRQIFSKSYQNSGVFNQNLELNNVQSGVYLVTVQDGDRKEVKKIVIQ